MTMIFYTLALLFAWQGPVQTQSDPTDGLSGNWKLISIFVDESKGLMVRPEDMTDEQCIIRFESDEEGSAFAGKTIQNQIFGNYETFPGDNYEILEIKDFGSTKVLERGFGGQMMRYFPKMTSFHLHKEIGILEMKSSKGVIFQFQALE